jgi:hypothetical protein
MGLARLSNSAVNDSLESRINGANKQQSCTIRQARIVHFVDEEYAFYFTSLYSLTIIYFAEEMTRNVLMLINFYLASI